MIGRERGAEDGVGGPDGQGRRVIAGAGTGPRFELVRDGTTRSEPGDELPDAAIAAVVDEVAAFVRVAEIRCAYEVGRIIADRCYRGDPAAWHQGGGKSVSLRKLALGLRARGIRSASVLYGCLGTYEVGLRQPRVLTSEHPTPSHVQALLRLAPSAQDGLIDEIEANKWSVRELRREVAARFPRSALGRPAVPGYQRALRQFETMLAPDGLAFQDIESVGGLDDEARAGRYADYLRVRERFDQLGTRMKPRRTGVEQGKRSPSGDKRTAE